jgi:lipopolysaccharide/colanic/teichoic acid biosynthesis glycosyltransferase
MDALLKRLLDAALAALGLIALGPVILGLGWLVRHDSTGPAIYRARRVGLGGREFRMLKLRTMVENAAQIGPGITYASDPRITRVGRVLRATKLDELPQFVNVLRGEMSLVGPRPEAPDYVELYPPELGLDVLSVRPGVFGISQMLYRDEEQTLGPNVHEQYVGGPMMRKLRLDRAYVRRRSLRVDLELLLLGTLALVRDSPRPTL